MSGFKEGVYKDPEGAYFIVQIGPAGAYAYFDGFTGALLLDKFGDPQDHKLRYVEMGDDYDKYVQDMMLFMEWYIRDNFTI